MVTVVIPVKGVSGSVVKPAVVPVPFEEPLARKPADRIPPLGIRWAPGYWNPEN